MCACVRVLLQVVITGGGPGSDYEMSDSESTAPTQPPYVPPPPQSTKTTPQKQQQGSKYTSQSTNSTPTKGTPQHGAVQLPQVGW